MNNNEILKKAKELVELMEKQEKSCRVRLSELNPGDIFQTTGKRKHKVLEQCGDTTKIISLDVVKENVKFGDNTDYNKSNVKKMCDTEILKDFEEEFGAENIEEHTVDIITVDGQKIGVVKCKVRPLTFLTSVIRICSAGIFVHCAYLNHMDHPLQTNCTFLKFPLRVRTTLSGIHCTTVVQEYR